MPHRSSGCFAAALPAVLHTNGVITAKVLVSLLLAADGAVFDALVTAAGLGVAAATGRELDGNPNPGVLVGYLVYVLLNVLTGVAFGDAAAQLCGCHRPVRRTPRGDGTARPGVELRSRTDRLLDHLQLAARR